MQASTVQRMRRSSPTFAIALLLAPCSWAQTPSPSGDPMAWAYGNTLEITIPSVGYKAKRYVEPDGTWRSTSNYTGDATGKWETKDGKTCFTQTEPTPEEGYRRTCSDQVRRAIGDVWFSSDVVTGNLLRMDVIGGRD
jgi:hypothetical protein